jgi:hypothetical protein
LCRVASTHGFSLSLDDVIPAADARLMAAALRRGAGDFGGPEDRAKLSAVAGLLELGQGVVVTRRGSR